MSNWKAVLLVCGISGLLFIWIFYSCTKRKGEEVTVQFQGSKYAFTDQPNYFDNGNLESGKLAEAALVRIGTNQFYAKSHTYLQFYTNGMVASVTLLQNETIQGIPLKKDNTVQFYAGGKLQGGVLADKFTLASYNIAPGYPISFYESGKLNAAFLRENTRINGIIALKYTPVSFFESKVTDASPAGPLASAVLTGNMSVQGYQLMQGSTVEFYPNGKLYRGTLAETRTINGLRFNPMQTIELNTQGKLGWAYLPEETEINGIRYKPVRNAYHSDLDFYENGHVKIGYLAVDTTVDGVKLKGDNIIAFYESGRIKLGFLAQETALNLNGKLTPVPENTAVVFNQDQSAYGIMLHKDQELILDGRKILVTEGSMVKYKDIDNGTIEAVGEYLGTVDMDEDNPLTFDTIDYTWFKYLDPLKKTISKMMRINDGTFTYKGRTYPVKAFEWIAFDSAGNVIR